MESDDANDLYKECLRNHAASLGSYATDGCGEFTLDDASPSNPPMRSLWLPPQLPPQSIAQQQMGSRYAPTIIGDSGDGNDRICRRG
ncbi:hypothetical protein OIU84_001947 [Salix udensis]|uniref:ZF-HD dimerization-type domain-containing protein n=1 Tax=Salix udensis TaxID=889485 RepID=A0AAD6P797_9ROSI|nr:hypothetical protein OIU84_001947 [Salix udensis]